MRMTVEDDFVKSRRSSACIAQSKPTINTTTLDTDSFNNKHWATAKERMHWVFRWKRHHHPSCTTSATTRPAQILPHNPLYLTHFHTLLVYTQLADFTCITHINYQYSTTIANIHQHQSSLINQIPWATPTPSATPISPITLIFDTGRHKCCFNRGRGGAWWEQSRLSILPRVY